MTPYLFRVQSIRGRAGQVLHVGGLPPHGRTHGVHIEGDVVSTVAVLVRIVARPLLLGGVPTCAEPVAHQGMLGRKEKKKTEI